MVRKLFLIFLFIATQQVRSCSDCWTTTTTDSEVGTITGHSIPQNAGCNCPCNKKRHHGVICSECGHTVVKQKIQGNQLSKNKGVNSLLEKISKRTNN